MQTLALTVFLSPNRRFKTQQNSTRTWLDSKMNEPAKFPEHILLSLGQRNGDNASQNSWVGRGVNSTKNQHE